MGNDYSSGNDQVFGPRFVIAIITRWGSRRNRVHLAMVHRTLLPAIAALGYNGQ